MATRVQNESVVNFGTLATETVITHARVGFGANELTVQPLATPRTVVAGGEAEFGIGEIDLVFPSGDMQDAGMSDLLALYFAQDLWVDGMTDDSTVVVASGYSQQTSSDWARTQEAD